MAARHLRRLQEQLQATTAAPAQHSSESEEEDELVASSKPFNPFDLLSDNEVSVQAASYAADPRQLMVQIPTHGSVRHIRLP